MFVHKKPKILDSMKMKIYEDITPEKLSWLIQCVDEMFSDTDESENDTY